MAGIAPRFLQESATTRSQRNLSNFRVRTGQKFGDIAKQKLFEQGLVEDVGRQREQTRTALAFREQERREEATAESKRQFDVQQQATRRERKREEKFDPVKTVATVVSAFT